MEIMTRNVTAKKVMNLAFPAPNLFIKECMRLDIGARILWLVEKDLSLGGFGRSAVAGGGGATGDG